MSKGLVDLCIESATKNSSTIDKWRRQRRTLERMPPHLAQALLRRLLDRRLVSPSLLEVFQYCIEEIDLKGETPVDAEWMAYLGAFRYLRMLNVADCRGINSSALWAITGMNSLKELDLSRCVKFTDTGVAHLLSISNLEKLHLSETGLTANGVAHLSLLKKLSVLDLGGLPVTDMALRSLQVLTKLEYLDLWGSKVTDEGVTVLKLFPKLSYLNLAWTSVTKLPNLPSLTCLNMSKCTIHSIFKGESDIKTLKLEKLLVPGATFSKIHDAFSFIELTGLRFLDMSNSSVDDFWFLSKLEALVHLDLSFSKIGDDSLKLIARVGGNVKVLNLSNTRVSSAGIGTIVGNVPNIEILLLSHTDINDLALPYIGLMPSLRAVDFSNTKIKGLTDFAQHESDQVPSLTALQNLRHLERLNLEETQLKDEALWPLSSLHGLHTLSLKSNFLTDISLATLSSLSGLKFLALRGAVLTNSGLDSFNTPPLLEILDLRDCWLLTEQAISMFCQNHPKIEVRHEQAKNYFNDHSSAIRGNVKNSHRKSKRTKMPLVRSRLQKEGFVDERLKYSRQELLELQFSPLSRVTLHNHNVLPKMLTE
ncbi:hypothetical protein GIB67_042273 [Kingdonia uniflora]|uniref:Uncharacterized protein n=1 Tax=Kingdonia uniflora TaxID=39325 RepID=A0A7J7LE89_9MAGN|nr:hypothetical protein GIB67_042273 [Kingdonia uniflora]